MAVGVLDVSRDFGGRTMTADPLGYLAMMRMVPWIQRELVDQDWLLPLLFFHADNLNLRPHQIREEFLSAQNNAVSVLYEPSGRPLDCYPNVAERIQQHGGRAVLGWQIAPSSLISAQTVGGVELETHCVWLRPDGCLVEITPQPHPQQLFAPSDIVKDRARAVIVATVEDEIPRLYNMKRIERTPYINVARNSLA